MNLVSMRNYARGFLGKFVKNEAGVTAIEYAIVAAGVAAVVMVIFAADGGPVHDMLEGVFTKLQLKLENVIG